MTRTTMRYKTTTTSMMPTIWATMMVMKKKKKKKKKTVSRWEILRRYSRVFLSEKESAGVLERPKLKFIL